MPTCGEKNHFDLILLFLLLRKLNQSLLEKLWLHTAGYHVSAAKALAKTNNPNAEDQNHPKPLSA